MPLVFSTYKTPFKPAPAEPAKELAPEPCQPNAPAAASSLEEALRQLGEPKPARRVNVTGMETADPPVPEDVGEALAYWIDRYPANPEQARRKIRALAAAAPDMVAETALRLLREDVSTQAALILVSTSGRSDKVAEHLCDPSNPVEDAVRIVKTLARHDPLFDVHFARRLLNHEEMSDDARKRGLTLLEALGPNVRMVHMLIQFLRNSDTGIRSRAASMLGRVAPSVALGDRLMREEDARVRANFVEGLWDCQRKDFSPLLRQAVKDPHHRVAANALVGLHRQGEHADVIMNVGRMARHADAQFRAATAWAMGEMGENRFAEVLRHLVNDPDATVRRNASQALNKLQAAQNSTR